MSEARVIYNDDFRTIMSHNQATDGFPSTVSDLEGLVERVGSTGVTTYVMDAIGFDNKVFFDTKRGSSWTDIDYAKWGGHWEENYGAACRFLKRLRAEGRDALQVVIDSCRKIDVEILAGARMNDCQGVRPLYPVDNPDLSFFLLKNPDLALRYPGTGVPSMMADFGQEAVRQYKFGVLEELMETFDFDGLELNWQRFPWLFQPDFICGPYAGLTPERFDECAPLLTEFMVSIRDLLDKIGRQRGKQLILGTRVAGTPEINRIVGIDLPEWIRRAKLDYVVPTAFITTDFNLPVERFKRLCQDSGCSVYPCLFPSADIASAAHGTRLYQTELYAGAASNYYAAGADGVEVFNHFHPPTMGEGIPFNTEALRVISSPDTVAQSPVLRYYMAASAEPANVAEYVKGTQIAQGGILRPCYDRLQFVFRFGEALDENIRRLEMLRFRIFEASPEDGPPRIWLNDTEINCTLSWRCGPVAPPWSWAYGKKYEDLELLAGKNITEDFAAEALELLSIAPKRRPEYARQHGFSIEGPDIYMLAEADPASIPNSTLESGVNYLWVKLGEAREAYTFEPTVGGLEIATVRVG